MRDGVADQAAGNGALDFLVRLYGPGPITKARMDMKVIVAETPQSADQTAAIRLLREAVMTANAAIALNGLV